MTQNSTIRWQTGIPKEPGKYLITTRHNKVRIDICRAVPDDYGNHWEYHYDEDVIAWCLIENIEPFKI